MLVPFAWYQNKRPEHRCSSFGRLFVVPASHLPWENLTSAGPHRGRLCAALQGSVLPNGGTAHSAERCAAPCFSLASRLSS